MMPLGPGRNRTPTEGPESPRGHPSRHDGCEAQHTEGRASAFYRAQAPGCSGVEGTLILRRSTISRSSGGNPLGGTYSVDDTDTFISWRLDKGTRSIRGGFPGSSDAS